MRAVSRNIQNLLQKSQYSFSGFGKSTLTQLDHTILISTRTISSQEHTPPINNSTTSSKIKTKSSVHPFVTCVMSIPSDNQDHSHLTMEPILWRTWKNYLISSLWAKISTTAKWTSMRSWEEYQVYWMYYQDYS